MPEARQNKLEARRNVSQGLELQSSRRNGSGCSRSIHGVAFLCGISTPSLSAQGEQRRSAFFNIRRDIGCAAPHSASVSFELGATGLNWFMVVAEKLEKTYERVVASYAATSSWSAPAEGPPTYRTLPQLLVARNHCPSALLAPPTVRWPLPPPRSSTQ